MYPLGNLYPKQQSTNCIGSQREAEIFVKHRFLQKGRHNSYQTYWYDTLTVPPVSNQQQRNCNCTVRQTHSLLLPTQAYNKKPFLPGKTGLVPRTHDMDWERRCVCSVLYYAGPKLDLGV